MRGSAVLQFIFDLFSNFNFNKPEGIICLLTLFRHPCGFQGMFIITNIPSPQPLVSNTPSLLYGIASNIYKYLISKHFSYALPGTISRYELNLIMKKSRGDVTLSECTETTQLLTKNTLYFKLKLNKNLNSMYKRKRVQKRQWCI